MRYESSLSVFDYFLNQVVFTISLPSGGDGPLRLISLSDGGPFSNDEHSEVSIPAFIV